jgi:PAS domain S-box-containing protein
MRQRLIVPRSAPDLAGLEAATEDFFAAVLQATAQPVFVADLDGLIRFANAAAIEELGYDSGDELLGRNSHAEIHRQQPDGVPHPVDECPILSPARASERASGEVEWFARRDGSLFPVSWVSVPIEMSYGRGAVVSFTNITDRLANEQTLIALADEQAALRRVATLVARESSAMEIFEAVAQEVAQVLGTEGVGMLRFEDDAAILVAQSDTPWDPIPPGTRFPMDGDNVVTAVYRSGQFVRLDDWSNATGSAAAMAQTLGIQSSAATPIVVAGRLWGTMIAVTRQAEPLPAETDARIRKFTELLATAISNAEARGELAASRMRIVTAADEERRRVVRDLHDGAQQRLVHTIVTLKLARRAIARGDDDAAEHVDAALSQAEIAIAELRELAHGILPAVLTRGGLHAGIAALASRAPVPVAIDSIGDRLPAAVEATAYFVVAEALTNVAKHAQASWATVSARIESGTLRVEVHDDGTGLAAPPGSGLLGLRDRLSALDGRLTLASPPEGGTLVVAEIPLPD